MKPITFISVLSTLTFLVVCTIMLIRFITFEQNCGGHLKRAANANTPEIALEELYIALQYMKQNNLTEGYTSVIYRTPSEDIGFTYNNLLQSFHELSEINENTSSLEKSNVLLKLRETLLDNSSEGDSLAVPAGISRYPYNTLIGISFWVSLILVGGCWFTKLINE